MTVFTVSLFGHREIDDLRKLEKTIMPLLKELIKTKTYVSFLIGRNGEFDEYVASIIKRIQNDVGKENCDLNLVLPYKVSDIEFYEDYYDSVIIPDSLFGVHPKSSITLKNRWMIEKSDLVIVFVNHKGGAYTAMQYSKKLNKPIINLCDTEVV